MIKIIINIFDQLKELWISSKDKNILRKRNKWIKIFLLYSKNINILDEYLLNDNDKYEIIAISEIIKKNLKRKYGE